MSSGDSLYVLAEEMMTVIEGGFVFDEDTGEILWDSSNLEQLAVSTANKVEAVVMYGQNRRALADAREAAAKQMLESAKALRKEADRLDSYAMWAVSSLGGKLETPAMTIRLKKCPPHVEVLDMDAVPPEYIREKVTVKRDVDKTAVKAAVKSGEEVPGVAVVWNEKIEIK